MTNLVDKESVPFAVFLIATCFLLLIAELLLGLVIESMLLYSITIVTISLIVISYQSTLGFFPIFWMAIIEVLFMLFIVIITASITSIFLFVVIFFFACLVIAIFLKILFKQLLSFKAGQEFNNWIEKYLDLSEAFIRLIIKPLFKKYILQETH